MIICWSTRLSQPKEVKGGIPPNNNHRGSMGWLSGEARSSFGQNRLGQG